MQDFREAFSQRVGEAGDLALVHAAAQVPPAPPVPAQVLPVLARVAGLLQDAHAGEIQHQADILVLQPVQERARLGDGVFRRCWECPFGDAHMGKAERWRDAPIIQGPQQARTGFLENSAFQAVRHAGDGSGRPRAHRHDFDANGFATGAARDQHARSRARERIEHGAIAKAQGGMHQIRRETFLVFEPAQAGLHLIGLPRDDAAVQVGPFDHAMCKTLPQGLPRPATARGFPPSERVRQIKENGCLGFAHRLLNRSPRWETAWKSKAAIVLDALPQGGDEFTDARLTGFGGWVALGRKPKAPTQPLSGDWGF